MARKIDLARFIYALGIRNVGIETAIDLAARFGTLANLSGEFRLGCKVSVQLENMTLTDLIREVKLDFTPDGEVITPIVCDAFKFNWTRPMPFATENRWQLGEIGRNWK